MLLSPDCRSVISTLARLKSSSGSQHAFLCGCGTLLDSLQHESDSDELPKLERKRPAPTDEGPEDVFDSDIVPPDDNNFDWVDELRGVIYQLGIPDGINFDAIEPGIPTPDTTRVLDTK